MTRLIDADALKEAIEKNGCKHSHYFDIFDVIDNAPTVAVDNYAIGYQDGVRKVFEERKSIFVVSVREEIDGEDVVYHRYFSSERKAETFINDNLKGQIVMSLSEEEVT